MPKKQNQNNIESRLLTANEAGKYLHLHPETVYEMARKGELRSVKTGIRGVRFDRLELDRWIKEKLDQSGAENLSSPWNP